MPRNPRVDAYIEKAPEFARPILTHLREVVHAACPEVDEQIKWGMPSFEHKGPMCGMAAFKGHCALSFWKHQLLFESRSAGAPGTGAAAKKTGKKTAKKTATKAGTRASAADAKPVADESAMGEFGRITSLKDLPSKRELTALIKRAVRLNDEGVKAQRTPIVESGILRGFVMSRRPGTIREIIDVKTVREAEDWDQHKRIEDVMDLASFVHLRTHVWKLLREQQLGDQH